MPGLLDRFFPKLRGHLLVEPGLMSERVPLLSNVVSQEQHRHIASDAVRYLADPLEHLSHPRAQAFAGVVQLGRIVPGWKIGVAAEGDYFT